MTPNNATPDADADADATSGFDWQRYKDERRVLYEKLLREDEQAEPPAEPDTDEN